MRNVYESGVITELTQGAIINNCIAEDFSECETYGCVITPRCDLANKGKVSTFHYLPIVDFETWVIKVVKPMLLKEYTNNLKEKINSKLRIAGAGENLIDVFQEKNIILLAGKEKMKSKDFNDFEIICNQYYDGDDVGEKMYLAETKHYKKLLEDLVKNNIHGYYLIESWEAPKKYKIIVLRDVRRMSIATRAKYENWEDRGFEDESFYRKNDVSNHVFYSDYYRIVSCLKSPFIENIMQSFSYNFTRIGVPSFDVSIIDDLSQTIKSILS